MPAGRLEIICGCMFAGKTARLIALLEAAAVRNRRVIAFKHRLDARYDPRHLATHDGRRFDSLIADNPAEIVDRSAHADVIGIDEAQFFGRGLVPVCEQLRARGQRVIVAGIDHDAWGHPFPPLPQLKDIADAVELMHAGCNICGRPARFSQRIAPLSDPDMVGGPAEYQPRCETCFVPLPPPAPDY
jgi:thymidine kinase